MTRARLWIALSILALGLGWLLLTRTAEQGDGSVSRSPNPPSPSAPESPLAELDSTPPGDGRATVQPSPWLLQAALADGTPVGAEFWIEDLPPAEVVRLLGESTEAEPLALAHGALLFPRRVLAFARVEEQSFRGWLTLMDPPASGSWTVTVQPEQKISGRVVFPDGTPVGAGFQVVGTAMQGASGGFYSPLELKDDLEAQLALQVRFGVRSETTTDADGAFVLSGFAPGDARCWLQSAGPGWGTNSWPGNQAYAALGASGVELVVHPLYAVQLPRHAQTGRGDTRTIAGSTHLDVDRSEAQPAINTLLRGRDGDDGDNLQLSVYTAPISKDWIPGTVVCQRLVPKGENAPSKVAAPVQIPRWKGGRVPRLEFAPCWSLDDLVDASVHFVGGVGLPMLRPDTRLGGFYLRGDDKNASVARSVFARDLQQGTAIYRIPRGNFDWALDLRAYSAGSEDFTGTLSTQAGETEVVVDLSGVGGLLVEFLRPDGSPFVGHVSGALSRVFLDEEITLPNGQIGRNMQGVGSQQNWEGPPYLAATLKPGKYHVTMHTNTWEFRALRAEDPFQTVLVHPGELSVVTVRLVPEEPLAAGGPAAGNPGEVR